MQTDIKTSATELELVHINIHYSRKKRAFIRTGKKPELYVLLTNLNEAKIVTLAGLSDTRVMKKKNL